MLLCKSILIVRVNSLTKRLTAQIIWRSGIIKTSVFLVWYKIPLKNLTLSVLPQFWVGWGLGTGKEHKCFSSLYLKQMLTSAQIKQVCNWSNTAFRRYVMLGLVYIAAVHVVCEYHTWHFEDSWVQSLLTNPLRPGPCQQTWLWASDGVVQASLVFRLVLSLIPMSANV